MEGMIERLEGMLAKGTDNMLLRFSLGKAYAEQDCFREAEEHLRASLAFDPAYSVAWKWLGKACLGRGDKAGARAAWESGLQAAHARGDQQVVKELQVFIRRLDKDAAAGA
jgi:predicted Zn-dependent protease